MAFQYSLTFFWKAKTLNQYRLTKLIPSFVSINHTTGYMLNFGKSIDVCISYNTFTSFYNDQMITIGQKLKLSWHLSTNFLHCYSCKLEIQATISRALPWGDYMFISLESNWCKYFLVQCWNILLWEHILASNLALLPILNMQLNVELHVHSHLLI